MNLSKNLIVALLGLGCYARCNNINLANNTSILLIILALLARQNINNDTENGENNIESTRTPKDAPPINKTRTATLAIIVTVTLLPLLMRQLSTHNLTFIQCLTISTIAVTHTAIHIPTAQTIVKQQLMPIPPSCPITTTAHHLVLRVILVLVTVATILFINLEPRPTAVFNC